MDINEIVNSQINLLEEMITVLDEEREVLIKDKAERLAFLVDSKKEIAQKIAVIERERQNTYGDKKASEFIQEGMLSQEQLDHFKKLANEIHEKNETNMVLTKQSLNYIRLVANALNPRPKVVTYGSNGKVGGNSFSGFSRNV